MRGGFLRGAAVFLSGLWTIGYAFTLFAETWFYCYGTHPFCAAGWLPRTTTTAVYLLVLGGFLYLVRRQLRKTRAEGSEVRRF